MASQSTQALVSIIIPSFNQGRFIRETIDSTLNQDYRALEILVIDGGSTDNTVEVLKSYSGSREVKWWSEPDKGVADAVNKGLRKATGEILAIQSSDDVYLPGAVTAAVGFMQSHPDVALVYGDVDLIDEHSSLIGRDILTPFSLRDYLGRFTYIPQPSAFFRAGLSEQTIGWRAEVSYAADADFWMRIAVRSKVMKIDRLLARYRYHSEQRDTQKARIAQDWEKSVRDLIASGVLDLATTRFGEMGIYLAKYRYTPESDWKARTRYLYRAAAANPAALFHSCFPKRELFPGREPIWKVLSRLKRRLGFRPRISTAV